MKIGIFGGTFDPVHNGHLALARAAVKEIGLDRLILVPARRPPLKSGARAPAAHRLRMLKLAAKKIPRARVSSVELNRPGTSYTVDTVRRLCGRAPDNRWYLVMGGDSLAGFKGWKDRGEILRLCTLAVARRKGMKAARPGREMEGRVLFLKSSMPEVSSTQVRAALKKGKNPRSLLPPRVLDYIRRRGLYA